MMKNTFILHNKHSFFDITKCSSNNYIDQTLCNENIRSKFNLQLSGETYPCEHPLIWLSLKQRLLLLEIGYLYPDVVFSKNNFSHHQAVIQVTSTILNIYVCQLSSLYKASIYFPIHIYINDNHKIKIHQRYKDK